MSSASPAWIDLDGAVNVRDLAGLPAGDGRRVQPHRLIRADNLQDLTVGDIAQLREERGLRSIVDLRTTMEVEGEGPGPLLSEPEVTWHHLSLIPEVGQRTDVAVLPWQATREEVAEDVSRRGAGAVYLRYLEDRGQTLIEALRVIARSPGATVVHCAAGKDRTGTVVAMALSAVGVDREAIVADYAASGERIEQILGRLVASPTYAADVGLNLDQKSIDRQRPRAATMAAFLDRLDQEYGGAQAWLAAHGWTAEDQASLEDALLG